MKIAVYTICKNEQMHVERFMKSACEADEVVILDTGSTDNSVSMLRDLGATVIEEKIIPWRFDSARNANLKYVSDDVDLCLSIDLDEFAQEGWRELIESVWCPGINRIKYWYNNDADHLDYHHHKCHSRHGWFWRNIVHEDLIAKDGVEENAAFVNFVVYHRQDVHKSREQYDELLKIHISEYPKDVVGYIWMMAASMEHNDYEKAIEYGERILNLSKVWIYYRGLILVSLSECAKELGDYNSEFKYIMRACVECSGFRDVWATAAKFFERNRDYHAMKGAALRGLEIKSRLYVNFEFQSFWMGDLEALAAKAHLRLGEEEEFEKIMNAGLRRYPDNGILLEMKSQFYSQK